MRLADTPEMFFGLWFLTAVAVVMFLSWVQWNERNS